MNDCFSLLLKMCKDAAFDEGLAKRLLSQIDDVNGIDDDICLLFEATENNNLGMVKLLLESGADPNIIFGEDDSPLWQLTNAEASYQTTNFIRREEAKTNEKTRIEIFKLFLAHGADLNLKVFSDDDDTILDCLWVNWKINALMGHDVPDFAYCNRILMYLYANGYCGDFVKMKPMDPSSYERYFLAMTDQGCVVITDEQGTLYGHFDKACPKKEVGRPLLEEFRYIL